MELVSVIIAAYNASETIVRCLDSVKKQTYPNIEVVVVNDGSTDGTKVIVEDYIAKNVALNIVLFNQINAGPSIARNNGIKYSTGKYIAFLDSDDEWFPEKVENQIECFLKYTEIDLVGCGYCIGGRGFDKKKGGTLILLSKYKLLFKNYYRTPCVMLKSSWAKNISFKVGQHYSEDYLYWLQAAFSGCICAFQTDILVNLYDKPLYGASGLSGKLWQMEKGELLNYKSLYDNKLIPLWIYWIVLLYSLLKYFRRIVITLFRNIFVRK